MPAAAKSHAERLLTYVDQLKPIKVWAAPESAVEERRALREFLYQLGRAEAHLQYAEELRLRREGFDVPAILCGAQPRPPLLSQDGASADSGTSTQLPSGQVDGLVSRSHQGSPCCEPNQDAAKSHAEISESEPCTFRVVGVRSVGRAATGELRIVFDQAVGPGIALTFSPEAEAQIDYRVHGQAFCDHLLGKEASHGLE